MQNYLFNKKSHGLTLLGAFYDFKFLSRGYSLKTKTNSKQVVENLLIGEGNPDFK